MTFLETGVHEPLPVEVRVNITEPAVVSAIDGLYVVIGELAFANEPVPFEVHVPPAAC